MPLFVKQSTRTLLTHVGVGMGAASFWRGAWYVLDDHLFPDNAEQSAAASLALGVAGMMASQGLMHKCEELARRKFASPLAVKAARFGALYTVAMSCVLVWRGTWVGWDCVYERLHPHNNPHHPIHAGLWGGHASDNAAAVRRLSVTATDRGHATHSGILSHVTAVTLLLATGLFASVLAPPAAVSVLRDWAVRTQQAGGGSATAYQGPAQVLAQRLFGGGSGAAVTSAAASKVGASSSSPVASAAAAASASSSSAASRALSSASARRTTTTTVYPVSAASARRQW